MHPDLGPHPANNGTATIDEHCRTALIAASLEHWLSPVKALLDERMTGKAHGDMPAWQAALQALPPLTSGQISLDSAAVSVELDSSDDSLGDALARLKPWRKGPFRLGDISIDTEWRSDLKWDRVIGGIAPLTDRRVLDVGCGNGYYGFRMLGAGAASVIGIDPTLLFHMQFKAINRYVASTDLHLIPARLEELPAGNRGFDTVFSMGVLYHQRSPIDHLRQLHAHLHPDGELVLETLILPGEDAFARTPGDRYARMRNVWLLPTVPELRTWLLRTGFDTVSVVDLSTTTTEEQRATEWMPFESLAAALDPEDSSLTVEGWPAPTRVVISARPRRGRR